MNKRRNAGQRWAVAGGGRGKQGWKGRGGVGVGSMTEGV